jgi:hypothetical protein
MLKGKNSTASQRHTKPTNKAAYQRNRKSNAEATEKATKKTLISNALNRIPNPFI